MSLTHDTPSAKRSWRRRQRRMDDRLQRLEEAVDRATELLDELKAMGCTMIVLDNQSYHYRGKHPVVGRFDIWATTAQWHVLATGQRGRGLDKLLFTLGLGEIGR